MSESEKQTTAKVHESISYPEDKNFKAASSPSNASEEIQDAYDGVNEKALIRKLDWKLLPPVTLLYLMSFLDRSNGRRLNLVSLDVYC